MQQNSYERLIYNFFFAITFIAQCLMQYKGDTSSSNSCFILMVLILLVSIFRSTEDITPTSFVYFALVCSLLDNISSLIPNEGIRILTSTVFPLSLVCMGISFLKAATREEDNTVLLFMFIFFSIVRSGLHYALPEEIGLNMGLKYIDTFLALAFLFRCFYIIHRIHYPIIILNFRISAFSVLLYFIFSLLEIPFLRGIMQHTPIPVELAMTFLYGLHIFCFTEGSIKAAKYGRYHPEDEEDD